MAIKFDVIEELGFLNEPVDNWGISVDKVSWNEQPSKINIRNRNKERNIMGKGVAIDDDATNRLVDILLNEGYGSTEEIVKAIKNRDVENKYSYTELELVEEAMSQQGYDVYIPGGGL